MNKPVVITSGNYKGYNALVEKINNNKLKLDITFESFFLPKTDKNINIISDNKLLLSANVFTDIIFKIKKQDISKILELDPELITKFSDNDWIVRKIFNSEQKRVLKEYGFIVVKENKNFSFLQVNNLVLNYISGPNNTVQIESFDAYIKIESSFLEQSRNKTLKMFFYPFFFKYSHLLDNDISNDVVGKYNEYNSSLAKKDQITLLEFINKFLDKKSVQNKKNSDHYMIIKGSLSGRIGKTNKTIAKKDYSSFTLDNEDSLPLDFGVPIIIGNNTQIQNNFWQIKINKSYPLTILRLETDNKIISLYRDEFKNIKEIEELESSLKNMGLSSIQATEIIKEEMFLTEDIEDDKNQVLDFEDEILEDNQELDYQEEPDDINEEQVEDIIDEIEEEMDTEEQIEEIQEYQVGFKEKDQFSQNSTLSSSDKGLLDFINQTVTIFKVNLDNTRKIFEIVKNEKERRRNERFDVNNFVYAAIMFFSDMKEPPRNKKIKINKNLLLEYSNYLKVNFNAQSNPEDYLSLKAEKVSNRPKKSSYYYSNIWKNNKPKYLSFQTTKNNITSRIKNEYTDIFEDQTFEIENEYLISLKENSLFDDRLLYQVETLLRKAVPANQIKQILVNNGLERESVEKYLGDFLSDNQVIPEFEISTSHVIISLLEFLKETVVIEPNSILPSPFILNRFISQSTTNLSLQSFSNIINNLNLSLPGIEQVFVKNNKIHNLKIKDYFSDSDTQTKNVINLKLTEIRNDSNLDSMFFNEQELSLIKNYVQQELVVSEKSKISLYEIFRRFFKYFKISVLEQEIERIQNTTGDNRLLNNLTDTLNYVKNPLQSQVEIEKNLIPVFGSFQRLKEILELLGFGKNMDNDELTGFEFRVQEFNPETFYSDKLKAKAIVKQELDQLYDQFLEEVKPYFRNKDNKLQSLLPTVDDFYDIAFLVRISDRESLNLVMGYKTEQIIEILASEYNITTIYISELIKKCRDKVKDKTKNSLSMFIEAEKNNNIGIIDPEFFEKIHVFVSNTTFKYKKNTDVLAPATKEYYMKPLMKNFPKEITFLNDVKNLYINKIINKMRELEERKIITIIQDVETEIEEVNISFKKNDKIGKKINSYFPRKTDNKKNLTYSKMYFNNILASKYKINKNLSNEIIKELEDKFINIYLEKDNQSYSLEYAIILYNKWKTFTWGDNQSLPAEYKAHLNLFNFIDYVLRFFFLNIVELKYKPEIEETYRKYLYYYKLGKEFKDFNFESYLSSIINSYYGVIYKDVKNLLVEMFFEKEEKDFEEWVDILNEELKIAGKPIIKDKNNIIISNYYKLFNFCTILSHNMDKDDILSILNPKEKIRVMLKYNIPFDLSQALEPFISRHLTLVNIQNILTKINQTASIDIPNYKIITEKQPGLVVQETINTVQAKNQIMKTKMYNIVHIINNEIENEYMSFFQDIVFWRGTDKETLDQVWPFYYKAYFIMKSLSLFQYEDQKDNYIIDVIIFFLSLPAFSENQISLLKAIPKKISKSLTENKMSKETQDYLFNWILENPKRKREDSSVDDLTKKMKSTSF